MHELKTNLSLTQVLIRFFFKDGQVLELTHVCDIRLGKQPNVIYLLIKLNIADI